MHKEQIVKAGLFQTGGYYSDFCVHFSIFVVLFYIVARTETITQHFAKPAKRKKSLKVKRVNLDYLDIRRLQIAGLAKCDVVKNINTMLNLIFI